MMHVIRDPRTLAIMIVMPLVMLILLGYAATTDVEHLRTAVYDADKTAQSRALIDAYRASNYFDIVDYADREEELANWIDRGDVHGALIIPAGYGRAMVALERSKVAFLIDGSDPTVANTAFAASQQVGQAVSIRTIQRQFGPMMNNMPGLDVRPRVWYNPNMESSHFMIPGLMVVVLFLFTTLFTSTSIVRERELGTLEQLIVTPIRPLELVVAKVLPYIIISFLVLIEVLVVGVLVFGVPVKGNIFLLLGLSSLFIVTALGIGIFISSLARTQLEAFLLTFATILPAMFLSGLFFPIDAMPGWLQMVTYVVPARYGLIIIRSILLKGAGLEVLMDQVVAVLGFSVVIMLLAAVRFKKKL
jgi:ABC-2 type transport system permease protein